MINFNLPYAYQRERNFFGGGGTPSVQQPPAPQPTPTPITQNPVATATDRAATLKRLQYGLSSTVAAGAAGTGMTGSGSNLTPMPTPGAGGVSKTGGA